jgi:hypothetical protein
MHISEDKPVLLVLHCRSTMQSNNLQTVCNSEAKSLRN